MRGPGRKLKRGFGASLYLFNLFICFHSPGKLAFSFNRRNWQAGAEKSTSPSKKLPDDPGLPRQQSPTNTDIWVRQPVASNWYRGTNILRQTAPRQVIRGGVLGVSRVSPSRQLYLASPLNPPRLRPLRLSPLRFLFRSPYSVRPLCYLKPPFSFNFSLLSVDLLLFFFLLLSRSNPLFLVQALGCLLIKQPPTLSC